MKEPKAITYSRPELFLHEMRSGSIVCLSPMEIERYSSDSNPENLNW